VPEVIARLRRAAYGADAEFCAPRAPWKSAAEGRTKKRDGDPHDRQRDHITATRRAEALNGAFSES
jgi:hypothetical protein